MAKVIIIAGFAKSLINFRGELINDFIKLGYEVVAMAPEKGFEKELLEIGAIYRSVPLQRNGMNVFKDIKTLFYLAKILYEEKPSILLLYTIKPVIYGSIAAKIIKLSSVYSIITGLGYAFTGYSHKRTIISNIVKFLYKIAFSNNKKVFFQNPDDLELFTRLNLLTVNKTVLINGSGVNTTRFALKKNIIQPVSFLLIARLVWDKGIAEYVKAARMLKEQYPEVNFNLLGPFDDGPAGISQVYVESLVAEGTIYYLGETNDVRPYIADASIYVLPSYREGTPRSILEAMSMGRPVVTTDAPGCRETVKNGFNGFLVPVKDSYALAKAMEYFILNPEQIPIVGARSREIAEEKYDVRKVNRSIIHAMGLTK